jgi:hypothetical protein
MSGALPFLAIGLLLIVVLVVWALRTSAGKRALMESCEDDKSTDAFHAEALPQKLTDRLFGSEDWDFICTHGTAALRHLFLQQRKALALSWLRTVRTNARKLIHSHLTATRTNSRLELLVELRVGIDYLLFVMVCQLIALAIWLRGPIHLGRLIGYTDALSERLHELIARVLPAELASENNNRESHAMDWRGGG